MTYTRPDPIGTLYTLLSTYWSSANTSNITPAFDKKAEFVRSKDGFQVLMYPRIGTPVDVGRGSLFDLTDLVTVEVRAASTTDTTFKLMVQEVQAILGTYRVTPGGGYDYVTFTNMRDESYAGHNWFRMLIDVELRKYSISKT